MKKICLRSTGVAASPPHQNVAMPASSLLAAVSASSLLAAVSVSSLLAAVTSPSFDCGHMR